MNVSEFGKAISFLDDYIDFSCKLADTDEIALDSDVSSGRRTETARQAEVVSTIIGALVNESFHDNCHLLSLSQKYLGRIYRGERNISANDALYIIKHQDLDGLAEYLADCLPDDGSLLEDLCNELTNKGYETDVNSDNTSIANSCARLIHDSINSLVVDRLILSDAQPGSSPLILDSRAISNLQAALNAFPHPQVKLTVPPTPTPDEQVYIEELYKAYADAEGLTLMDETIIGRYEEYAEDLSDHRIEYFAAESIRRSLDEYKTKTSLLDGQYEILKKEIYSGIKPLIRMSYPNGYEKLQRVMFETQNVPTNEYILSNTPHWISGEIKKGVCHFLVNEGKFKWVKKRNG